MRILWTTMGLIARFAERGSLNTGSCSKTLINCYDREVNRQKSRSGSDIVALPWFNEPRPFLLDTMAHLIDNKKIETIKGP
jgi:hypothetical protein